MQQLRVPHWAASGNLPKSPRAPSAPHAMVPVTACSFAKVQEALQTVVPVLDAVAC